MIFFPFFSRWVVGGVGGVFLLGGFRGGFEFYFILCL